MSKEGSTLQNITTLLAYALPLLQFFFALLPLSVANFFAFRDYFMIVSIFTAVLSYILILVFKSTSYFKWAPFQNERQQKNNEWNTYTDRSVHTTQDIRKYEKNNKLPKPVKFIDNGNIVIKLLVPLIILSFIFFCILGAISFYATGFFKTNLQLQVALSLVQAIAYSFFLVSAVLAFANQFLRESGLKQYRKNNAEKFNKAIDLVRERDGFREKKSIQLISQLQKSDPQGTLYVVFYLSVGKEYFVVITDFDVDMIYNINRFTNKIEADNFLTI